MYDVKSYSVTTREIGYYFKAAIYKQVLRCFLMFEQFVKGSSDQLIGTLFRLVMVKEIWCWSVDSEFFMGVAYL